MHRSPSPIVLRAGLVAVLLGGLTLACGQSDIAGPGQPAFATTQVSTGSAKLTKCNRQSARIVSRTVDAKGGTLTVNGHQLVIPPGALSQAVTITMKGPVDTIRTVQLLPEGLTFNPLAQPTLYVNYAGCQHGVAGIAYVGDDLGLLAFLPTTVDTVEELLITQLAHFSRYAVHY
jgi:hypothetical protein